MTVSSQEKLLLTQAKSGDEASFELLLTGVKSRAYNIALRYMRDPEDAMDVLQESFIKVFRHLKQFNEESSFDTWVYRIVVNSCNDMLRKNNRIKTADAYDPDEGPGDLLLNLPDSSASPEELLMRKEQAGLIMNCLDTLGDEYREVIILRDIQGFSYIEISQALDCSIGTVKSRINRARLRLREKILEQKTKECV